MGKQYVVQVFRYANNAPGWVTMTTYLSWRDAQAVQLDFERDNPKDMYRTALQGIEGSFKTEDVK